LKKLPNPIQIFKQGPQLLPKKLQKLKRRKRNRNKSKNKKKFPDSEVYIAERALMEGKNIFLWCLSKAGRSISGLSTLQKNARMNMTN